MLRVLITGGAGYIGSVLIPALLSEGHEVTALDSFMFNQNSLLDCCSHERFHVVRGDCRNRETMAQIIDGQDVIIPLAALVGASLCNRDPLAARSTNLDAIELILELRSDGQRILFPNTNSGYGVGDFGKHCTEESPLRPITLYGVTKVEAEQAIIKAGNAICFRLATVFGMSPRMRLDLLVNDFVYRAVNDRTVVIFEGHFKRNYIHIRDIARVFLHSIQNFDTMKNEVYNVGLDDANLSKLELCEKIKHHVPDFVYLEAPIGEDPDKRDYIVSNEKILGTGFLPNYSLGDGIRELVKGFTILNNSKYSNV
jgi:nucleoside-diphosphate-sugar epimerase